MSSRQDEGQKDPDVDETPAREISGSTHTLNILSVPHQRRSRSVEYTVAILQCFMGERHALGIADIAELLGLSRSTTHRYASTLMAEGWLEQDAHRKYRLASAAADVGLSLLTQIAGGAGSWPVLKRLRAQTGHTASFGVLDGRQVTYVQRAHSHGRGQYLADGELGPGTHRPLHCTAMGKAMLASQPTELQRELVDEIALSRAGPNAIRNKYALLEVLTKCKAAGFAIDDEEHTAGVRSVAVAIEPLHRQNIFAVEVTVPAELCTVAQLRREIGPKVQAAARTISTQLKGAGPEAQ